MTDDESPAPCECECGCGHDHHTPDDQEAAPPTKAEFLPFISSIVAQTLIHLGKMPFPTSGDIRLDLPNARFSIDLLTMLRDKTEGNRSAEESDYLTRAIFGLQTEYVQVARDNPAPVADAAKASEPTNPSTAQG